uniref:Uncharacterized protein n=1 Tax=Rhizophora mucronata TaxID=61149 RepID=A0A2P2NJJ0_RHIMU
MAVHLQSFLMLWALNFGISVFFFSILFSGFPNVLVYGLRTHISSSI